MKGSISFENMNIQKQLKNENKTLLLHFATSCET